MNFDLNFLKLIKNEGIIKFRTVTKNIPYGYIKGSEKAVKTKKRDVLEIVIDTNNMDWLQDLDERYVIQIGDTFYRKGGNCFVYDYNNQSNDFSQNLEPLVYNKISIFIDGDLPNQSC